MSEKTGFHVEVSGYVSEVLCGEIPVAFKEAFTRYIMENRDEKSIPPWLLKSSPHCVSSEQIQQVWYFENRVITDLMEQCGGRWNTCWDVNNVFHFLGFGSGKEGIGIFEMAVVQQGQTILEFVPFEPTIDSPAHFRDMKTLSVRVVAPPLLPCPEEGYVLVSAGAWRKGILRFHGPVSKALHPDRLEILEIDLTDLGVGEDHFVAGLRYDGEDLSAQIVKTGVKEMYPVSWFSPRKQKWRPMYEND